MYFKIRVIVFVYFFPPIICFYGEKQGSVLCCFPGIPQQPLSRFCSKSFLRSVFRIQIAFSHGRNVLLVGQVPRPSDKSLFSSEVE